MNTKPAELAGTWYPAQARALTAALDGCLAAAAERSGPEDAPSGRPEAAVVPHAGLAYSGAAAAAGYLRLRARRPEPQTLVVFGACHRARLSRPVIWPDGEWETPLGPVHVDAALAAALIDAGIGTAGTAPFAGDNAIELQMPFIRHLFPKAAVVPVAMPFLADAWKLGELAAAQAGETAAALASTDLTHYGASFGVMPAGTGEPALRWARENDARFLHTLTAMELENIVPAAERDGSACGAGAAAAAAGWARARGCACGRLLVYSTSHDKEPGRTAEHFVGYASVIFES